MSDSETSTDYPLTPPSSDSWRSAGDRFRARVRANGARSLAGRTDDRGRVRFKRWDLQRLQGSRSASIPPLLGARGSEHTTEDPNNFWPRGREEQRARRPSIGRPAMSQQKEFIQKIRALQRRQDPSLSARPKTPRVFTNREEFTDFIRDIKKELLRPQTHLEAPRPLIHQLVRPPYRCADPVSAPSSDGYDTSYEAGSEDNYDSSYTSNDQDDQDEETYEMYFTDDEDEETYYSAAEIEETYFMDAEMEETYYSAAEMEETYFTAAEY